MKNRFELVIGSLLLLPQIVFAMDNDGNALSELAQCPSLECVENILYKEERYARNKVCSVHSLPAEICDTLDSEVKGFSEYLNSLKKAYPFTVVHDEERLGHALVKETKDVLARYNINPNEVNIVQDEKMETSAASARPQNGLRKGDTMTYHPATIAFNPKEHMTLDLFKKQILTHEATHLQENHGLAAKIIVTHIPSPNKNDVIKNCPTYKAWIRTHEKQAEIFPLTRFGDIDIERQLVVKKKLEQLMLEETGNKPSLTHPGYNDLFPYIDKIADLKKKGAVPLYEKRT